MFCKKNTESGRSMVEIIAVLLLIGILSVGAIVGYSYAVNLYKANETIEEIQRLAVDHVKQLNRPVHAQISIAPQKTKLGYKLHLDIILQKPDLFEIELTDVPEGVCTQILKSNYYIPYEIYVDNVVFQNGKILCQKYSDMKFLFERELNGKNGPQNEDEECVPECAKDMYCYAGRCVSCLSNADCSDKAKPVCDRVLHDCVPFKCPNGSMPENGVCKNSKCHVNTQCPLGQFCQYSFAVNNCGTVPTEGKCEEIGAKTALTDGQGQRYIRSGGALNWWSATNWCAAQGARLVRLSDFCSSSEIKEIIERQSGGFDCVKKSIDTSEAWTSDVSITNACSSHTVRLINGWSKISEQKYNLISLCLY